MIKILLLLLLLCSCQNQNSNTFINEREYIEPISSVNISDNIDSTLNNRIIKANKNQEFLNYQFKMLFKDVYSNDIKDINDNTINLKDYNDFVLEIVSTNCSHCKNQIHIMNDLIEVSNITLIQYFNVGDSQDISRFYEDEGIEILDNKIIIPSNDELRNYVRQYLNIKFYPTFIAFKDNKVSFVVSGELNESQFNNFIDIGLKNTLSEDDFLDKDGNSYILLDRDAEAVKNSISLDNQKELNRIDNDNYTADLTYSLIGKKFNFDNANGSKKNIYFNQVDDYNYYLDKQLVVFYLTIKESDEQLINDINSLIDEKYEYLVILNENSNSSNNLKKMQNTFKCKVVSSLGYLPDEFNNIAIKNYPSVIFIDRGVITGAYSSMDIKDYPDALEIFLSDNSIAYKENN